MESFKTEIWVQGSYQLKWTDIGKVKNIVEGVNKIGDLKSVRPNGEFRLIERTIIDKIVEFGRQSNKNPSTGEDNIVRLVESSTDNVHKGT